MEIQAIIQRKLASRGLDLPVRVVCNPEFLRMGTAVRDFLTPDRVVVGSNDATAVERVAGLFAHAVPPERLYRMDAPSAELAKYAANCFLATKISFINEMANLCETLGADIDQVRMVMAADPRIGPHFLAPGVGYGGSCLPKDVKALIYSGTAAGYAPEILPAVDSVNTRQRERLVKRIATTLGGHAEAALIGRRLAIWGLSFKPGTDDMRDAPSITVIQELLDRGATVQVYDPAAMAVARRFLDSAVYYANDPYSCAEHADAVVLLTEWPEFQRLDLATVRARMAGRLLFDARNALDVKAVVLAGLEYRGAGRSDLAARAGLAGDAAEGDAPEIEI